MKIPEPEISVHVDLNTTLDVAVHVDEVIEAINTMPLKTRINYIGMIFNGIDQEDFQTLENESKEMVNKYLDKLKEKFKNQEAQTAS